MPLYAPVVFTTRHSVTARDRPMKGAVHSSKSDCKETEVILAGTLSKLTALHLSAGKDCSAVQLLQSSWCPINPHP